jgi:hypothetical protein
MSLRSGLSLLVILASVVGIGAACGGHAVTAPKTSVPRVTNRYVDDAFVLLRKFNLRAVVPNLPPVVRGGWNESGYVVVAQRPDAGSRVHASAAVSLTLELSLNLGGPWPAPPRYVVVPDVYRWAVDAAFGQVTNPARGLVATIKDGDPGSTRSFREGLQVVKIQPTAGSRVRSGTEVILTVRRFG